MNAIFEAYERELNADRARFETQHTEFAGIPVWSDEYMAAFDEWTSTEKRTQPKDRDYSIICMLAPVIAVFAIVIASQVIFIGF